MAAIRRPQLIPGEKGEWTRLSRWKCVDSKQNCSMTWGLECSLFGKRRTDLR